jgi:hypothetical protein
LRGRKSIQYRKKSLFVWLTKWKIKLVNKNYEPRLNAQNPHGRKRLLVFVVIPAKKMKKCFYNSRTSNTHFLTSNEIVNVPPSRSHTSFNVLASRRSSLLARAC